MSKKSPHRKRNHRIQLFNKIADELNLYEWHIVPNKNYDVTITDQLLIIKRDN